MLSVPLKSQVTPLKRLNKRQGAFTLAEVLVAALVLILVYLGSTQCFLIMNRRAAVSRLQTAARVVVERNIDQALGIPFSGTTVPGILATTADTGVTYDDDGNGDGKVNLMVQDSNGPVIVSGTLTRIVSAVTNAEDADVRRVTFRLTYNYRGRDYAFEMTTLRSRG